MALGRLGKEVKLFTWLESHRFAGGDGDFRPGSGVASDSSFAWFYGEDAEAAKLDTITCDEGFLHAVEDCVDRILCLDSWQTGTLNNALYKILLDHLGPPSLGCKFGLKCLKTKTCAMCRY